MPTVSDATVVASAYDTSGNGGRKLSKLDNGWFVSVVYDSATFKNIVLVSKDSFTTTPTQLCWTVGTTQTNNKIRPYIVTKGNFIYLFWGKWVAGNDYRLYCNVINAEIQTNVDISANAVSIIGNITVSDIGEGSAILNGTKIEVSQTIKWVSLANSFNISYLNGTINADGSVAWGAAEQITVINTSGNNLTNPSIIIYNNQPMIFVGCDEGTKAIRVFTKAFSTVEINYSSPAGWGNKTVYSVTTYAQSSPSAIFVPASINGLANGRIHVGWNGSDNTDNNVGNIRYSYSDDGGVTWSSMVKLTSGNTYSQDSVSLTADKNNNIYVLFQGVTSVNAATDYRIKQIKNTGGTWGSISEIKGAESHNPSALFDLTISFTQPLFIYKSVTNAKVGFYGTWTITTISVTQGDIGTKSDKTNLLTYSITTDGTMTTITESINGTVTGTKTATSGQSLIAGLTQAQWDAIIYGKYADATGGKNTLTVSMGADTWTYTFDKRLATTDDINAAIKAAQDNNNTALAAKKALLGAAIRGKGGTVNDTDMLETMVSVLNSIVSGRKASGTITSGSTPTTVTFTDGTTASGYYMVNMTGLLFKPSSIILFETINKRIIVYSEIYDGYYPKTVKLAIYGAASSSQTMQNIKGDISPVSVTNGAFALPVFDTNTVFNWIANE